MGVPVIFSKAKSRRARGGGGVGRVSCPVVSNDVLKTREQRTKLHNEGTENFGDR